MKKISLFWILFFCVLLTGCGSQAHPLWVMPSETPIPTPTETSTSMPPSTPTIHPTATTTPTVTPTSTPFYPIKQVLLDYYVGGFHTSFDLARDWTFSQLVLYTDGQMIISGKTEFQKQLSQKEMDQFFSKLETLGFYALEVDEEGHATNNLYTPDNPFEKISDGEVECVLTITDNKKRDICAYGPYMDYLVPEMRNTLKFLDEYPTTGMTPYFPDRILLNVQTPTDYDESYLPEKAIEWPTNLLPLKPRTSDYELMFVQGSMAAEISAFFYRVHPKTGLSLFRQNGKEYVVMLETIWPHEELDFSFLQP